MHIKRNSEDDTTQEKNAVVFAAGGAIASEVALTLSRAGANVYLSGRSLNTTQNTADKISAIGGFVSVDEVDATDESSVADYYAPH